jgi:hypothetical protein
MEKAELQHMIEEFVAKDEELGMAMEQHTADVAALEQEKEMHRRATATNTSVAEEMRRQIHEKDAAVLQLTSRNEALEAKALEQERHIKEMQGELAG